MAVFSNSALRRRALVLTTIAAALHSVPAWAEPAIASLAADAPERVQLVAETRVLNEFSIAPGEQYNAPPGKSLTMTVDGVNVPMRPGLYRGKVVLSVTEQVPVKYKELAPHNFRTALYVADDRLVTDRSVVAAAAGAEIGNGTINNAVIRSQEGLFNGIIVAGKSKYVINNPVIDLTGNGGNDFAGYGAAIMSSDNAEVTVNNAKIRTHGAIRPALFIGGNSVMHVNHADIETLNGTLPSDYKFTIELGKMMEVPWMLGLSGNVRATNLVDHGTVYFNDSHIRTQGWGALSTDDAARVRMYVKNSLIETVDSGYGAYSIGDSHDHFSHSTLNVADIGLIMAAQGSGTFTDGTVVNSRRYGVMVHGGEGGGTLTIDGRSVVNSRSTGIQVKGRGTTILIDNAEVHAGNGVLVQAMVNDDPFLKAMMAQGTIGVQSAEAQGAAEKYSPDVDVTLRATTLAGDLLNTRTEQGGLTVKLERAHLNGAISTGTQRPASGIDPTANTYWQIGDVSNTLAPTRDKNGVKVVVGTGSEWVVDKDSYLTELTLEKNATLRAPSGYRVQLLVNGKPERLAARNYRGTIALLVSRLH